MDPATMFSPILSPLSAQPSSTPRKSSASAARTRSEPRKTGNGPPGGTITGVFRRGTPRRYRRPSADSAFARWSPPDAHGPRLRSGLAQAAWANQSHPTSRTRGASDQARGDRPRRIGKSGRRNRRRGAQRQAEKSERRHLHAALGHGRIARRYFRWGRPRTTRHRRGAPARRLDLPHRRFSAVQGVRAGGQRGADPRDGNQAGRHESEVRPAPRNAPDQEHRLRGGDIRRDRHAARRFRSSPEGGRRAGAARDKPRLGEPWNGKLPRRLRAYRRKRARRDLRRVMKRYVGRPIPRVEDYRLLTGAGRYTDDVRPDGQLHCAFLRSPHAHARIVGIDTTRARRAPGVRAVLTGA